MKMDLPTLAAKASESSFYRRLTGFLLNRMVPFNGPHRFAIEEISKEHLKVVLPYRKKNMNHLKGLHACALATLAEVTSGFLLISRLDPKRFRLILKRLEMDYHYQAKMEAYSTFEISEDWLRQEVLEPIKQNGKVLLVCKVEIYDRGQNHIATGLAHWQIKDWKMVRTSL